LREQLITFSWNNGYIFTLLRFFSPHSLGTLPGTNRRFYFYSNKKYTHEDIVMANNIHSGSDYILSLQSEQCDEATKKFQKANGFVYSL